MSGAISGPMIDAVLRPRCLELARAAVASRRGAWIDRALKTINAHNASLKENKGWCSLCGHSDHGIMWEPPAMDVRAFLRARFP